MEIGKLKDRFKEAWQKISASNSFYSFYCNLLSTLEQFTWCIPSDTRYAIADVSLYDHLKTTSAISACLYRFHTAPENDDILERGRVTNDKMAKFLLVGGDLSGIQNYLYQIAVIGEGGVAKRLRARSFYLSILVEITIHKILRALDLPISCNLISAGGRFTLLVPNTNEIKGKLADLSRSISGWFLEEFSGEWALNITWAVALTGEDFNLKQFPESFDRLQDSLERQKTEKFSPFLKDDSGWCPDRFIRKTRYELYREKLAGGKSRGDCHSCRKFPAQYPDPHEDQKEVIFCHMCYKDKLIGRSLIDARYIALGYGTGPQFAWETDEARKHLHRENTISFYPEDDKEYFVTPLEKIGFGTDTGADRAFSEDFFLVQRIAERAESPEDIEHTSIGIVNRFLANYIPFSQGVAEIKELCQVCKERERGCDYKQRLERIDPERQREKQIYTFSCIAAAAAKRVPPQAPEEYRGDQLLGILIGGPLGRDHQVRQISL